MSKMDNEETNNKLDFFENGDYKLITNLINEKLETLKKYKDFNEQYTKLYDEIDELEVLLNDNQKDKLHEITKLFYNTEEYYFALAYSLGVKYGKDLEKL